MLLCSIIIVSSNIGLDGLLAGGYVAWSAQERIKQDQAHAVVALIVQGVFDWHQGRLWHRA